MKEFKPRAAARPSPEAVLQVAKEAAPMQPSAELSAGDRPTTLNLRVRTSTLDALASTARGRGLTMKQLICQALASAGVAVAPADLEDRTPRRKV